jgi:hypothetical protein
MSRRLAVFLRVALTIALTVGMLASSNERAASHEVFELARIIADHQNETMEHGHAHEDIVDLMHAYDGHAKDLADHDHNIAFLPPSAPPGISSPLPATRTFAGHAMPDRNDFDLDRPPRA